VRFHFPWKNFLSGFFFLVQSSGVVILATLNYFIILSFHLSLFVLPQFALLPD
jgi:ABC-type transport system involved in cytochrome c biogenesis permease subunit